MKGSWDAALRSWPFDPWLLAGLLLTAIVYLRGWWQLARRDPGRWPAGRLAAFGAGLGVIYLALASPIEPFASLLLSVHMLQHLLLMMAAPALVWLGAPLLPLVRGVPRAVRMHWLAPLLRSRALRHFFAKLTHPVVALPVFIGTTWLWHLPAMYSLALRNASCHYLQHVCFLGASLVFWYPVVRPYPSRPRWSSWILLPYLLLADIQNTILSALLTFSSTVLYPHYLAVPSLGGLSPLEDQAHAGVLMWVPGSIAFLVPLFWIALQALYGSPRGSNLSRRGVHVRVPAPLVAQSSFSPLPVLSQPHVVGAFPPRAPLSSFRFDLLRTPVVGHFLRWRHARIVMQLALGLLAGLVICDGLSGPQSSPLNLAGVLPWIHWRGLVVLSLLVAGNFFCMACPFTLPRSLARRWLPGGFRWPRILANKWLAVGLLVVFLWAYEAFSLWDSPWWTAWIALAYFGASALIDGLFGGATFCKYVCPIGQFNFVQALVSPLEVAVREPARCTTCHTHDCLQGREALPGCQLQLFQPRKVGNMDCTFCLDCVHACPHDNVGLLAVVPGRMLWADRSGSGIGRLAGRADVAALVVVLVFGAFANAAGMIAPVVAWQDSWQQSLGLAARWPLVAFGYLMALGVLPLVLIGSAAALARRWGHLQTGLLPIATRWVYSLVPLGGAMWVAHYSFHFFTSYAAVVPAFQRFVRDWAIVDFGAPRWVCACCAAVADWIPRAEILLLDAGLLLSLYAGYHIALVQTMTVRRAMQACVPWAVVSLALFVCGVVIVLEPMEMRGTLGPSNTAAIDVGRAPSPLPAPKLARDGP